MAAASVLFKEGGLTPAENRRKIFFLRFWENRSNFFVFEYFLIKIELETDLVMIRPNPGSFFDIFIFGTPSITISKIIFIDRSKMTRKQVFCISEPLAGIVVKLMTIVMY